ncbi:MAG: hypothetical protein JWM28_4543 [Chitinophagaceae bacterium]|nr:hypothetical protein [Chitinophagaceae bacterium]
METSGFNFLLMLAFWVFVIFFLVLSFIRIIVFGMSYWINDIQFWKWGARLREWSRQEKQHNKARR